MLHATYQLVNFLQFGGIVLMAAVEQLSQTKPSQLHVRTYINIYTSRHTFMYACACINTHTHIHIHACIHIYIYIVCTYIHVCVCTKSLLCKCI